MTFGFNAPEIHHVADITADAERYELGPEYVNAGRRFARLKLTICGEGGEATEMLLFFEAGFIGRALDIAEAINASKVVRLNAAE